MIRDTFHLASRYLLHHRWRSAMLVLALAVLMALPIMLRAVLDAAGTQLGARAAASPLLLGARASDLDLVMNGLYFTAHRPPAISLADANSLRDSGLARVAPLYVRHGAGGAPVVGTSVDYLALRGLRLAEGRAFAWLGEAVLGARAARRLGLGPGGELITDTTAGFNIAGAYPLALAISGVLAASGTADDDAVFVDLRTAWVIDGLGHGHAELDAAADPAVVLAREAGLVRANAALPLYNRIDAGNRAGFHFHGDPGGYPLSAVLVYPDNPRAGTLLRGRWLASDNRALVVPVDVIDELLGRLLQFGRLVDGLVGLVTVAALVLLGLVYSLSLRLRAGEFALMRDLGAARLAAGRLILVELLLLLLAAGLLAGLAGLLARSQAQRIVMAWLLTA